MKQVLFVAPALAVPYLLDIPVWAFTACVIGIFVAVICLIRGVHSTNSFSYFGSLLGFFVFSAGFSALVWASLAWLCSLPFKGLGHSSIFLKVANVGYVYSTLCILIHFTRKVRLPPLSWLESAWAYLTLEVYRQRKD